MKAELLNTIPISSDAIEIHYGENFNFHKWVKFTDENFEDWFGCFAQPFDFGFSSVNINEKTSMCFIVAGGKGYLININTKKLVTEIEEYPSILSAIMTTNPDYFIYGTYCNVGIIKDNMLIEEIGTNFNVDGIYFKNQLGNKAIGELDSTINQYEEKVPFEFDLNSFKIELL